MSATVVERIRMDAKELGARLRQLREAMGLNQTEMAARLGMAQNSLSNWEQGKRVPSILEAERIAAVFGVTVEQLLTPARPNPPRRGRPRGKAGDSATE